MHLTSRHDGFSLIELLAIIVVAGILASVALQSMTASLKEIRHVKTEREMDMLSAAIVGDPKLTQAGARSDFGYVGDVGAFPPNLQALRQNPGGLSTWNGPYLADGFTEDNAGYLMDEWGTPYTYSGGILLISTGSGSAITRKLAASTDDYLLNRLRGTIHDGADNPPGAAFVNSVRVEITIPDGSGSIETKSYQPDEAGAYTLDSLPVGRHPLDIIYTPEADTVHRFVTILPRHRSSFDVRFAAAHFTTSITSCGGSGMFTLRPVGPGTTTDLDNSGCGANWQCVSEETADDNSSIVYRGGSFRTDLYEIDDASADECTVGAVRVYCRGHKTSSYPTGTLRVVLRTHGTNYQSSDHSLGTSWQDFVEQWNTNPNTGNPWTWNEIADLEAGVSLYSSSFYATSACTQVWVEVDYEP